MTKKMIIIWLLALIFTAANSSVIQPKFQNQNNVGETIEQLKTIKFPVQDFQAQVNGLSHGLDHYKLLRNVFAQINEFETRKDVNECVVVAIPKIKEIVVTADKSLKECKETALTHVNILKKMEENIETEMGAMIQTAKDGLDKCAQDVKTALDCLNQLLGVTVSNEIVKITGDLKNFFTDVEQILPVAAQELQFCLTLVLEDAQKAIAEINQEILACITQ